MSANRTPGSERTPPNNLLRNTLLRKIARGPLRADSIPVGAAVAVWLVFVASTAAGSDDAGRASDVSDPDAIRAAGSEATFRVIERFPDPESSPSEGAPQEGPIALRISRDVQRAMRRKEWKTARRQLAKRIGAVGPRLRFLKAYLHYKSGDFAAAGRLFSALRSKLPVVSDYCAYFGARSAREQGDHHRAVVRAARVSAGSRLYPDALYVLARSLVDSGTDADRRRARKVMRRYLDQFPAGESAAPLRLSLARLARDDGDWETFGQQLFRILEDFPLSDAAEKAEGLLEKETSNLSDRLRADVKDRPKKYRIARFRALFDSHRSETLIEELDDALSNWTPGGRDRCRGLYWMGKSHTKLREHDEAAEWYDEILEECAGVDPFEKKALYLGAKSYWNTDDESKALELYRRLWTTFDEHSYADDALHFAARIHREQGRTQKANKLLEKQVERYPEGDMAGDAHWLRVRSLYEGEDYEGVVDYLDGLDLPGGAEAGSRGRLRYFEGRALEKSGAPKEARDSYRKVADAHPLRYYALLALNRLARLDGTAGRADLCGGESAGVCEELKVGRDGSELPDFAVPSRVKEAPAYRKGRLLLTLGIRDWAEAEFDRVFERFAASAEATAAFSLLLHRAGAYHLSYSLPSRLDGWSDTYPGPGSRRFWKIAHPRAFAPVVRTWSRKRGLSEALVYAIMRKESGFQSDAESWANARGVMQLMWATARGMAREDGLAGLTKADLLELDTNVRLGTAYLERLSDKLSAHPVLMVAGYNGGYGNVSGWLDNRPDMPLDLWVEDIPYGQTRRYTKVAVGYYWAYRWLYGGEVVPRVSFKLGEAAD